MRERETYRKKQETDRNNKFEKLITVNIFYSESKTRKDDYRNHSKEKKYFLLKV